jgi:hypothetical protein
MNSQIDSEEWISLKEVAYLLRLSRHTIVRLSEDLDPITGKPYLMAWRPSPGTLLICRQSLDQFCEATQRDPTFWSERKQLQNHLRQTAAANQPLAVPVQPKRRARARRTRRPSRKCNAP